MCKNRFAAICLNKYSESKHWFCTWHPLWQFYNLSVPFGNWLKMNSYTGRHGSMRTKYYIWNSSTPMAFGAGFHRPLPILACCLAPLPCSSPALCGKHTRVTQPDLRGLLSTEELFIRVTATDRGRNAGKRMMISPSNGVKEQLHFRNTDVLSVSE